VRQLADAIEEGKRANFTVLSQAPHNDPTTKIQDITVEMTVINGKIAYAR
jgi:predicted amidohydrolase YtcJ